MVRYTLNSENIINRVFFITVFASLFYYFSFPEADPDLWGHLYFGREIVQSAKLPVENLYSFTAPQQAWINHEWLAEVVFYGVFNFLGSPGLILFKVIVGTIIVWLLDLISRKEVASLYIRTPALVWAMAILSPGFNIRPQLFTYLFFAVYRYLFHRYEEGKKASLYWVPLLMVLWVNLHGGFAAGLGAFGFFSFSILVRGLRNRNMRPIITQVLVPLILSGIALILNPYGINLLSFLAGDLLLDRSISEWQPIPLMDLSFFEFKAAVLLLLLIFLRARSCQRWDLILAAVAALLAFRYQRHTPLFAIVAAPLLAEGIQEASRWIKSEAREGILIVGLLTLAFYFFLMIGRIHLEHRLQIVTHPAEYPTQAADFLQRNGVRGNMAVPFNWGEYLIWKLYPEVRVSIDGRYTTAYPKEVIRDHWDWMEGKKGWKKLLEHYPSEIALTSRHHPVTSLLRRDPEWVYIYSDPVAFIFVRNISSQQGLLTRFKEKRLHPPQTPTIYFPG